MTTEPQSVPFSDESEQAFLSSLIQWPELIDRCDTLTPSLFFSPTNQTFFRMLILLRQSDQPIDFVICKGWLTKHDLLEDVGGIEHLNAVWTYVPTPANWEFYLNHLKEHHLRRKTIQCCQNLMGRMYDTTCSATGSIREHVEMTLTGIVTEIRPKVKEWPDVVDAALEYLEKPTNEGMEGVLFNIRSIDQELCGIRSGEYAVICAQPSVGKTALALQAALNTVLSGGVVAMFSFEMSAVRIALRVLSQLGTLRMGLMRSRLFTSPERDRLLKTAEVLRKLGFRMEDAFTQNINGVVSRCRALHAKEPLELIVVDYIQLVTPDTGKKGDNREREVADISRKLKNVAGELGVPLIALSQLNDAGQMRESKSISQDADIILRLDAEEGSESFRNVRIDKNRDGPRGKTFPVTFEGQYVTFTDAPVDRPDAPPKKNGNGKREQFIGNDR